MSDPTQTPDPMPIVAGRPVSVRLTAMEREDLWALVDAAGLKSWPNSPLHNPFFPTPLAVSWPTNEVGFLGERHPVTIMVDSGPPCDVGQCMSEDVFSEVDVNTL